MKTNSYRRLLFSLKSMFIFTIIFATNIIDIQSQPVMCNDDIHCSVGFFCHISTHLCHECLSCEQLKRRPGSNENECITSEKQCGPCLPGLITDEVNWGTCLSPEAKHMKLLTTHLIILVTCVASGVLISLWLIHGIWNTHIIKVNIAIPSCSKTLQTSELDEIIKKARSSINSYVVSSVPK